MTSHTDNTTRSLKLPAAAIQAFRLAMTRVADGLIPPDPTVHDEPGGTHSGTPWHETVA